ncbi:MAG: cell division protein FtsZ [Sphingomonadales bacterium]|nr:cell division protein FtsZ [Sphingomonadales bacterium]
MTISLSLPELTELKPRITVIGVGGAGGNAVNNMIRANLQGVDFIAANTDAQALLHSAASLRIQLGAHLTQGLGAGARPDVGRAAAEESLAEIMEHVTGSHMVFITAGMGGGTGTGAAPIIAEAIREKGILTVGVVTKPFQFEGAKRMRLAEDGIAQLQKFVDTLIIIPNQNLFRIATEKTTIADAFMMADEVLHSGVRGVTDLMVMPGLVNLDFADVRTVMSEMGKAMMGTGEAEGENRALEAAEAAISNPLLDEVSMKGAKGVLINITGGMDLTLFEVDEAANRIRAEVDADANILVGSALDDSLNGQMRVSVVATGIDSGVAAQDLRTTIEQRMASIDKASLVERAVTSITTAEPVNEPVAARVEAAAEEAVSDDLFIAPAPLELSRPAVESLAEAEPVMEAVAASAPQPEKKGPSWFERMTGRSRRPTDADQAPDLFRAEQAEPRITVTVERREPAVAAPSPARLTAGERVSGGGRTKMADQLDIPTFLRRQAN